MTSLLVEKIGCAPVNGRIVIVEDDSLISRTYKALLSREVFPHTGVMPILEFGVASDFLRQVPSLCEVPKTLYIFDNNMPHDTGYRKEDYLLVLVATLKQYAVSMENVIAISGNLPPNLDKDITRFEKPFPSSTFVEEVRRKLDAFTPVDSSE